MRRSLRRRATRGHASIVCLGVLAAVGFVLVPGAGATGTGEWTSTSQPAFRLAVPAIAALPDGRVLAVGDDVDGGSARRTQVYTPSTDTWEPAARAPRNWSSTPLATVLPSGKVLVATGEGGSCVDGVHADLYDPATDSWATTGWMAVGRNQAAWTVLADGRILVTGGISASCAAPDHGATEIYDPSTGTWASAAPAPTARIGGTAVTLADGRVLVAGGSVADQPTTAVDLYEPTTNTWASAESLQRLRVGYTVSRLGDGRVLVAGGFETPSGVLAAPEVFDPATGHWTDTAGMRHLRQSHTSVTLADGRALVVSGSDFSSQLVEAELFDPATDTWLDATSARSVRYGGLTATTVLADGRVLLVGQTELFGPEGFTGELYDPAATPSPGAVDDHVFVQDADSGAEDVVNILVNDSLRPGAATPETATFTLLSSAPAGITLDAGGTIDVAPGTAVGDYELTYRLCEVAHPTRCADAGVYLVVTVPRPIPAQDVVTFAGGAAGGVAIPDVLANDTLGDGVTPATLANVLLLPSIVFSDGISLDLSDGSVDIAPGTAPGELALRYRICDLRAPSFCEVGNVRVTVIPGGPTDTDGDGVVDAIDVGAGAFSDASIVPPTIGSIVDAGGNTVLADDAPAPDGVRITVSGVGATPSRVSVCGIGTLLLPPGADIVVTCGSVTVRVVTGPASLALGDGSTVVTVPAGATARISDTGGGTYSVASLAGTGVAVTVDGVTTAVPDGGSSSVATWVFVGFDRPVAAPPALNRVDAGDSIDLRWRLLLENGTPVTTLRSVAGLSFTPLSCATRTPTGASVALAVPRLSNRGSGRYEVSWRSSRSLRRTCARLTLDVGQGIRREALFRFDS